MSVQLFNLEHHYADVCAKRKISCPYGCGEEFRAEALELHAEFCMLQPIPCGVGYAPCARRLVTWVQGDTYGGNGYIVMCGLHKESPLVYCAKENKVVCVGLLTIV